MLAAQVLVETYEEGQHITRYVDMGPGAPHNEKLAQLGSGAMLQARIEGLGVPLSGFHLQVLAQLGSGAMLQARSTGYGPT